MKDKPENKPEDKKNLISFLETQGEIGKNSICFDGNHINADYFRDTHDIDSFQPYTITKVTHKEDNIIIDFKGKDGKLHEGFGIDGFRPHDYRLFQEFLGYLGKKTFRPRIC